MYCNRYFMQINMEIDYEYITFLLKYVLYYSVFRLTWIETDLPSASATSYVEYIAGIRNHWVRLWDTGL